MVASAQHIMNHKFCCFQNQECHREAETLNAAVGLQHELHQTQQAFHAKHSQFEGDSGTTALTMPE